jgi:UDP-glucose 4-epimerase
MADQGVMDAEILEPAPGRRLRGGDDCQGISMSRLAGQKVVVTGGAGFIGSFLARQLHAAGAQVVVVDNLANGKRENLPDVLGGLALHVTDIRDLTSMRPLLQDAAVVYHLACLGVRHSIHAPAENHAVNATATLELLHLSRAAGVGRFVHVSSSEVYGTARWAPMSEEHPTFPMTVYGAAKLAGESYARAYHRTYGYETVIVRPFNAFGPRCHHEGDSGEVIPKFMLRALAGMPLVVFGDGRQTRDFTFVADTAAGILAAGIADAAIGQTINLGSGREIEIGALAEKIWRLAGSGAPNIRHAEPRPGDVLRLCSDASLARKLLAFEPATDLSAGLTELLAWYRRQPRSAADLLTEERERNWI